MVWLSYFDKPDGEDCFPKIWCATFNCAKIGAVFAVTDIVLLSKPPTYYNVLMRAGHFMVPFAAMGATSAAISCGVATIRKKDDVINYIIGGFAGGSIWGATYRSLPIGLGVGVIGAACAVLLKISHRDNWDMLNTSYKYKGYGYLKHYERDYTLRADPKDSKE